MRVKKIRVKKDLQLEFILVYYDGKLIKKIPINRRPTKAINKNYSLVK